MTCKHFKHLARVLKNTKPHVTTEAHHLYRWEETCKEMASFCSTYNSAFDRYKFLSACGVDE